MHEPMPELCVVIPTWNANETLGLQLESLAKQIDPPNFEVIVVDNASTRSPDAVIDAWRDRLSIRTVRAAAAQGVAYARNVGLAMASCDKVVFCDADDSAAPSFLRAAFDALDQEPFLTGAVHTVGADHFAQGYDAVQRQIRSAAGESATQLVPADTVYPVLMGGACAVRRDDAIALGGFDQSYVPGAEDNDFGFRIIEAGGRLMRCDAMGLAERRRPTAAGTLRRAYDGGRMHMRLCAGHDLWSRSPHLREPVWWHDLARLPVAALRVMLCVRTREARMGLAGRVGLRAGQLVGFVTYRALRRPVVPELGIGFDEGLRHRV